MRKKHYGIYEGLMKKLHPEYTGFELPEGAFGNKVYEDYIKGFKAIQDDKDLSKTEREEANMALENQMIADPQIDIHRGKAIVGQQQKMRERRGVTELFKPTEKKGIAPGQPSPLMAGLTGAYGKEAAGGIGAATQAGVPMQQAAAMFPKKKTAALPTTPMFTDKQLKGGTIQKMQYNPKTKKHDIPFGKPKTVKDGHYFKLGNSYYRVVSGKGKLIQKGSVDEQSVMNAMREFGWSMMSEPDKIESVAMHKRILLGQGKSDEKGEDKERTNAAAAIAAGVDPEAVKAMYKKRTGKEY
jgi:hypothetical protein